MTLNELTDDALLSQLQSICVELRRLDARLIAYLIEVEDRRLELRSACSSIFDFCRRRLGMSEGAAYRRMTVAALARRFPTLLSSIESGKLHLSGAVLLRDHLTEENVEELVEAASGKTKREIAELVAKRAPRPDVPSTIRKLPAAKPATTAGELGLPLAAPVPAPARIEPISAARYRVQLTASAALCGKLERARDLMRHRNPTGDLGEVVEAALDLLLDKLEKERLGKTSLPARARRPAKQGHVRRAARREVFERDGEQCAFVDEQGRRCEAKGFLEVDHVTSRAEGGSGESSNLRVLCRPHNRLHAEEVFGREHVARQIDFRQRKSAGDAHDGAPDAALRGLVNLGFAKAEATRAVQVVRARHAEQVPIVELLREAIAVLT
jgi:RuvA, C-terminal domain